MWYSESLGWVLFMQVLIWNLEDHDGGSWLSASRKKGESSGPAKYSPPAPSLAPRFKLKVHLCFLLGPHVYLPQDILC